MITEIKMELFLHFLLMCVIVGTIATNSTTDFQMGESMNFTEEDIDIVIRAHKHVRSVNITACDMKNITWDDSLAEFAKNWSMKCQYWRNDDSMEYGKAVGQSFFLAAAPFSIDFHYSAVMSWLDQESFFTYSTGTCSEFCGHFAQLAYAKTNKVGCAASYCREVKTSPDRTLDNATFYMCAYLPPVPKTEDDEYGKLYRIGDECNEKTGGILSYLGGLSTVEKAIAGASGGAAFLGLLGAIVKFCKGTSVQPSSSTQGQNDTNGKASTNAADET